MPSVPHSAGRRAVQLLIHEVAEPADDLAQQQGRREDVEPAGGIDALRAGIEQDAQRAAGNRTRNADAAVPDLRNGGRVRAVVIPEVDDVVDPGADHPGDHDPEKHRPAVLGVLAEPGGDPGAQERADEHRAGDDDPVPVQLERADLNGDGIDHRGILAPIRRRIRIQGGPRADP